MWNYSGGTFYSPIRKYQYTVYRYNTLHGGISAIMTTWNLFLTFCKLSSLYWNACWLYQQPLKRLSLWCKTYFLPPSTRAPSSPDHPSPYRRSGSAHRRSHRRRASSPASWKLESWHTRRVSWIHPVESDSWCSNSRKKKGGYKHVKSF